MYIEHLFQTGFWGDTTCLVLLVGQLTIVVLNLGS